MEHHDKQNEQHKEDDQGEALSPGVTQHGYDKVS
jgi:hypothetical protein